jgi:hypothetical protein
MGVASGEGMQKRGMQGGEARRAARTGLVSGVCAVLVCGAAGAAVYFWNDEPAQGVGNAPSLVTAQNAGLEPSVDPSEEGEGARVEAAPDLENGAAELAGIVPDEAAPSEQAPLANEPSEATVTAPRSAVDAGAPANPPAASPPAEMCGLLSCSAGTVCCNPSCGICVPEGDTCDETPCVSRVQRPVSVACGPNTCSVGQTCCNPTCGTCVPEGQSCDPTPCAPRITAPVSFVCGPNTCSVGQVCCNPSCGTCVPEGQACDTTPCVPRIQSPVSVICGSNTCSVGQVCCNPSCGTCAPEGESCDQTPCVPRIR